MRTHTDPHIDPIHVLPRALARLLRRGLPAEAVLLLVLGLLGLLLAGTARAQTPVGDFSAAPGNGAYAFTSSTPRTLPELLRGQGEPAQPVGHLFLPALPADGGKVGAVVFVHGSGGIYDAMTGYWPQRFNAAGLALFALDMFGPRGVRSTAEDQSQVPFSADLADAYAALRLLATHPRIDPARIVVLGTSRGGNTAWRTALERLSASQKLGSLRYAAHVMLYAGGCVGSFRVKVEPGVFDKAPMLWVHGEADDYTPIGPCRDYAAAIAAAGTPVEFVAIPGAHHKFDSDDLRRSTVRGAQRTTDDCPLQLDLATLSYGDRFSGERLSFEQMQAVQKSRCAAIGATVQGDRAARDQAAQAILAFLGRVLAR